MSKSLEISDRDVLIVVDVQYDFCPGGQLAVPRGDEVIAPINDIARHFRHVIITQDWHPPGHLSFASSHPGRKPHETIDVFYGRQILWPDHCVQGTRGAELREELDIPHAELIIRKGYHKNIDSYSVFFENDRRTPTGLAGYLRERGLQRAFFAGLALDFCVRYSAEDASRIGFPAVIIEDACRAIDVNGSLDETRRSISKLGVPFVSIAEVKAAQAE
ncbi:MAG: bifunctional nicotinamidase/pyrazinamidase [Proteobacteria bacterium]|nr:MAG: bifunctional nicotinamidase/pyrazinamidase [Pseudomonadota bacterium]